MATSNMTAVYGDGEDGGELILADLIKFEKYSVVVQAFNEIGDGPLSEPTTAQTMEDGTRIIIKHCCLDNRVNGVYELIYFIFFLYTYHGRFVSQCHPVIR